MQASLDTIARCSRAVSHVECMCLLASWATGEPGVGLLAAVVLQKHMMVTVRLILGGLSPQRLEAEFQLPNRRLKSGHGSESAES